MILARSSYNTHGSLLIELLIGLLLFCTLTTIMSSWLNTVYVMRYDARQLSHAIADGQQNKAHKHTFHTIPVICDIPTITTISVCSLTIGWQSTNKQEHEYVLITGGERHA